jgi:hypothetical protein
MNSLLGRDLLLTTVASAASFLWLPSAGVAHSVDVITCENALPHARITVTLNGQALPDVNVTIYNATQKKVNSFSTDALGQGVVPSLRKGEYSIFGRASNNLRGQLCLDISGKNGPGKNSFVMQLTPGPPESQSLAEMLAAATHGSVGERVKELHGVIQDQAGTPIAGAVVQVYKKGASAKAHPKEIHADKAGRFRASLPDGVYTLFFETPGFKYKAMLVEIARDAEGRDLRITLFIGDMSE